MAIGVEILEELGDIRKMVLSIVKVEYKPDVKTSKDISSDCSFLALSGGGANGVFGAGFLNG